MRATIVIPVYKNEESLDELANVIGIAAESFNKIQVELEIVLVIDGSPDKCLDRLIGKKRSGALPPETQIVSLSRNYGQIAALIAGIQHATGDAIICYSADLQDPHDLFVPMFQKFLLGNEVVLAVRESREDHWFRALTSRVAYSFLRSEVRDIPKGGFDFFLIGRKAKESLLLRSGSRRFLQGDILNLGFSRATLGYTRRERPFGKSAYNFRKRLGVFSDAFYDSSSLPIKFCTRLGFTISILGFAGALNFIYIYGIGDSPFNGFTAIATSILILGGLQLVLMGIIGEYIYRIYDIVRNRPIYVVDEIF
jgi:dolichol-phosphate mannosyltransferase